MSKPIALTLSLKPRETGFSFLSRLSARNGLSASTFGSQMQTQFKRVADGQAEVLSRLAQLAGISEGDLVAWSPTLLGERGHGFRGEIFHAKGLKETTVRGCPLCLREDAETTDLPPEQSMAIRGDWLPRHVTLCRRHRHPLVPLWEEADPGRRYDAAARFAEIAASILAGTLDRPLRDPAPFDLWFEGRLTAGPGDGWLDQFALYPAAHFCELLGRAVFAVKIPKWIKMKPEHLWCCFDVGFTCASQGEAAIRNMLNQLQELIGAPMDGPKKKFGALYDRLAHDLLSEGYRPFRNLLRDHIATTWPLGPGDDLMGEPVLERRMHSVLTASREVGIDPRRLRKLLAEAGWVRPDGEGRPEAWELFDAAAAGPFLQSLAENVSALDLQEKLCISRSQFDLLRQDGYLEPTLDGADHKPLWNIRTARVFVDGLLSGAEPVYVPMHDWCDIATAARRLKVRPGRIVHMIELRRLTRVGKHLGRDGYAAVLVTLAEVERLLERPEAKGLSIELFAKTVGMRPAAAMRMIRGGHIPTTEGVNPKTNAAQRFLAPADLDRFHGRFVTLRGLASRLGMSWQALQARLSEACIAPFSPEGEDVGALYEWDVIEGAFCCRWPKPSAAVPQRSPHTA